jgi:hypothetical protein
LRTFIVISEAHTNRELIPLDCERPDLGLSELSFEILPLPLNGIGDRSVDVDRVEEMSPAAQIQSETNGLLPRPP